jgi:hypothetical protein
MIARTLLLLLADADKAGGATHIDKYTGKYLQEGLRSA